MRRQCTALLAAAMVIGSVASGAGKAPPPPTLKDLPKRQVEIRKDAPSDNNSGKAMDNYRKFLELRNADPALRAEALRRLGDLSLESGELDRMATEVTAVDPGGAEPSGSTRCCCRRIRTTRAMTRCSTSWRVPTRPPVSPTRRWQHWTKSCAAFLHRATSPKCISAVANCCSRRRNTAMRKRPMPRSPAAGRAPTTSRVSTSRAGRCSSRTSMTTACRCSRNCSTSSCVMQRRPAVSGRSIHCRVPTGRSSTTRCA